MSSQPALDPGTRMRARPTVYARPFGDEIVLLEFGRGEYFGLDAVGAEIWQRLESGETLGAIAGAIVSRYDVAEDVALRDVFELVGAMRNEGLVEPE